MSRMIKGHIIDHRKDGEEHINVYSLGSTDVGRWLSNFTFFEFECEYGKFSSLEALYHYLGIIIKLNENNNRDKFTDVFLDAVEDIKHTCGKQAQICGRNAKRIMRKNGVKPLNVPNFHFEDVFVKALVKKLTSNKALYNKLSYYIEDGLPLVHYYVINDEMYYKPHFDWLIKMIERAMVKINNE